MLSEKFCDDNCRVQSSIRKEEGSAVLAERGRAREGKKAAELCGGV